MNPGCRPVSKMPGHPHPTDEVYGQMGNPGLERTCSVTQLEEVKPS